VWARLTELGFGLWLLASPFVFDHPSSATSLWITDIGAGVLLVVSTVLNYRFPSRRYYLAVPVLGAALIAAAFWSGPHPLAPARQNHIVVGLTIMMLGIVPNFALRPPDAWRAFHENSADEP
jgi:hypothetical protein